MRQRHGERYMASIAILRTGLADRRHGQANTIGTERRGRVAGRLAPFGRATRLDGGLVTLGQFPPPCAWCRCITCLRSAFSCGTTNRRFSSRSNCRLSRAPTATPRGMKCANWSRWIESLAAQPILQRFCRREPPRGPESIAEAAAIARPARRATLPGSGRRWPGPRLAYPGLWSDAGRLFPAASPGLAGLRAPDHARLHLFRRPHAAPVRTPMPRPVRQLVRQPARRRRSPHHAAGRCLDTAQKEPPPTALAGAGFPRGRAVPTASGLRSSLGNAYWR